MRSIRTKAVGVTRRNDEGTSRQDIIEGLTSCDQLELIRDQYNEHDENAVEVHDPTWGQIGFIKRDLAAKIAPLMDEDVPIEAIVLDVTGGDGTNLGVNIELRIYDGDTPEDHDRRRALQRQREEELAMQARRATAYAAEQRRQKEDEARAAIQGGVMLLILLACIVASIVLVLR